jgi:transposase
MLHVDTARWNQTPDDLRRAAVEAPHPRTRERFQALYEVTQGWSAFGWSQHVGRRHSTILDWIRFYNLQGPDALTFARTGGRPPLLPKSVAFSIRS